MENGQLILVATPIGNLNDISLRAIETLKEVDIIAAEDTRHTLKLLNHFEIKKKLISYHKFSNEDRHNEIITLIKEGNNIALVTDAGTPGISDPGERIVAQALENNISVTTIPGACAGISALIISGFPTDKFIFEGFLPSSGKLRKNRIKKLELEDRTGIIYEAPHRLKETINDLYKTLGDREIVIVRELTKKFEEIIRTNLKEACILYNEVKVKGEIVIILKGVTEERIIEEEEKKWEGLTIEQHVKHYITLGLTKKEAMKEVAINRNVSKREIYNYLVKNK